MLSLLLQETRMAMTCLGHLFRHPLQQILQVLLRLPQEILGKPLWLPLR